MATILKITKKNKTALFTDFKQLTKFGLSLSVVFSSVAGYFLGAHLVSYKTLLMLCIGGYCMVGASNAFNQIIEKDTDAMMKRTRNRPLPQERISVPAAILIGTFLMLAGLVMLYCINPKSAFFGAISIFLYTCVYTPLKPVTPLVVFVGAIPGAIPFMLGWVAATNSFGIEAGFLFMIQFFWQFPHFWAIAWLEDESYKKAGFKMLPMGKKDKKTIWQIVFYTVIMLIVSITPVLKITGDFYIFPITAVLIFLSGVIILFLAIKMLNDFSNTMAKKLMLAGVFYITVVQIFYVMDKFFH